LKGLQSVQFGSDKVDTVDVTDTNSPGGNKVFIPGLEDTGDCTITANSLPEDSTQLALLAIKNGHASTTFAFTYPTAAGGGSKTFTGIVTSVDESLPLDKEAKITYKVKISGAITTS
jgi:hypothetical protein